MGAGDSSLRAFSGEDTCDDVSPEDKLPTLSGEIFDAEEELESEISGEDFTDDAEISTEDFGDTSEDISEDFGDNSDTLTDV